MCILKQKKKNAGAEEVVLKTAEEQKALLYLKYIGFFFKCVEITSVYLKQKEEKCRRRRGLVLRPIYGGSAASKTCLL